MPLSTRPSTAVVMLLVLGAGCGRARPAVETPEVRFQVSPPASSGLSGFQLSPDGRRLVIGAKNQLWIRSLDSLDFQPLPDTAGAADPFWAPDGLSVGFFADGALKRIDLAGGPAVRLCDAPDARGGSWSSTGGILFASGGASRGIFRIPASGGTPAQVVTVSGADFVERVSFPEFLPDGRHFFYTRAGRGSDESGVYVGSVDGTTAERLLPDDTNVAFASRHLLFRRHGGLMAQPFDAATRQLTGPPRAIADTLGATAAGAGAFSASVAGALAYAVGKSPRLFEMTWVDRSGARVGTVGRPGQVLSARISPDARRLAFIVGDGPAGDLWVQDLGSGAVTQITSGAATAGVAWAPRSDALAVDTAGPPSRLSIQRLDVPHSEDRLPTTGTALMVDDWSADGKWLAYEQEGQGKKADVWLLKVASPELPLPAASSEGADRDASFSPDSRFVAYVREVRGRPEIHVQPFPAPGARIVVSQGGGTSPHWSRDGKALFYQALDDKLMIVPVTLGASFAAGEPRALFDLGASRFQQPAPDGQRFLVVAPVDAAPPLTIVLGWSTE